MAPNSETSSPYLPIESYGLIGNLHTIAMVSKQGSIDLLPFDRIDSPTVFASILDHKKGGSFKIKVSGDDLRYQQLYLSDSAVLLTRIYGPEGILELTDFMPVREEGHVCMLVRKLSCVAGSVEATVTIDPRPNYGKETAQLVNSGERFEFSMGDQSVGIRSSLNLERSEEQLTASKLLSEGETDYLFLYHEDEQFTGSCTEKGEALLKETQLFWKKWVAKSQYKGRYQSEVIRSAITLKLLTSKKYGSVAAAASFGLPEWIGGQRNWDYRYCWIRDAAFTMYAFLRLGYMEEAQQFLEWIKERCHEGELQILYAVDGSKELKEKELEHLEGYKQSTPVRIGNGAFDQKQNDIYGELLDTIYLYNKYGGPITHEFWIYLREMVDKVCKEWKQKDHGIWEVRAEKRHFLHSKMMSWVAVDRAIKIADNRSFPYDEQTWKKTRTEIYEEIYENFWSEEKQSWVQYKGGTDLDAALFLIPLVRMFSPQEPRWLKTMDAILKELSSDVLIKRYKFNTSNDGMSGQEGHFAICTFWYAESLMKAGEYEKGRQVFEKGLSFGNHLGLFSEQIDLKGQQLGNFAQAFTHLAIISAAIELEKA